MTAPERYRELAAKAISIAQAIADEIPIYPEEPTETDIGFLNLAMLSLKDAAGFAGIKIED